MDQTMNTIKLTRCGFPYNGNFSWIRFFKWVLEKRYNVIVDDTAPDVVICSNIGPPSYTTDLYTKQKIRPIEEYPDSTKKLFISGEVVSRETYEDYLNSGYFCLGYLDINHDRYLKLPSYVLDCWTVFNESRIVDTPFEWLLDRTGLAKDIPKNHFISVVQASDVEHRGKLYKTVERRSLSIKSSGPWKPTGYSLDKHQSMRDEYVGRIDGLVYRDKIEFFQDCHFNMAYQYHENVPHLIQEKIIHGYIADTIPIFRGNSDIEFSEINPECYINSHSFDNNEELVDFCIEVQNNRTRYKKMLSAPMYTDGLPIYFDMDRLSEFLAKVVSS